MIHRGLRETSHATRDQLRGCHGYDGIDEAFLRARGNILPELSELACRVTEEQTLASVNWRDVLEAAVGGDDRSLDRRGRQVRRTEYGSLGLRREDQQAVVERERVLECITVEVRRVEVDGIAVR